MALELDGDASSQTNSLLYNVHPVFMRLSLNAKRLAAKTHTWQEQSCCGNHPRSNVFPASMPFRAKMVNPTHKRRIAMPTKKAASKKKAVKKKTGKKSAKAKKIYSVSGEHLVSSNVKTSFIAGNTFGLKQVK